MCSSFRLSSTFSKLVDELFLIRNGAVFNMAIALTSIAERVPDGKLLRGLSLQEGKKLAPHIKEYFAVMHVLRWVNNGFMGADIKAISDSLLSLFTKEVTDVHPELEDLPLSSREQSMVWTLAAEFAKRNQNKFDTRKSTTEKELMNRYYWD